MKLFRSVLAVAIATALVLTAQAAGADGVANKRTKLTVRPKRLWHGY